MNKKVSKKRIDNFFKELCEHCRQDSTYSVVETAQKMGVDYEQVKAWAAADEHYNDMLQLCRECCTGNTDASGLTGKLPPEEAFKYMLESSDEFLALYPTPEAQEELMNSVKKVK